MTPRPRPTRWIVRVNILDGRRWHETLTHQTSPEPHVSAARAVRDAKRRLDKYTHIDEIIVKLVKVPQSATPEQEGK